MRHATATCPRCQKKVDLRKRTRLWEGASAAEAQAAAASLRDEERAEIMLADHRPVVRHDSPVSAAAAQANAAVNKSEKAELIATWLTRLKGLSTHAEYLAAMQQAGLDEERSEKEIIRMLATDVIYEPKAGSYRALDV